MSRPPGRVRRDGFAAMMLFLGAPFGALFLGALAHPAGLLDSEEEVIARTGRWRTLAEEAAAGAGVPVDLLLALVATESSGRERATNDLGAAGLTQVMPGTAADVASWLGLPEDGSVDPFEPEVNLRLGATYLGRQLRDFGGDVPLALAAYTAGPSRVATWKRGSPGSSGETLVRDCASPRVRAYVEKVLERRARFAPPPGRPR